jgi:hypothetical protein
VTDLYMAVLGHPQTGELMLLEWDETQGYSRGHVLLCQMKGFAFAGALSVAPDGTAGVICLPGHGAHKLMVAAIPIFTAYAAKKQKAVDDVSWLRKPHALQDTREN